MIDLTDPHIKNRTGETIAYTLSHFQIKKHHIVRDLFLNTADDNYITARWCFANRFHNDFFWLSVHSIEKYFKTILLLNDHSARKYGHNITTLYPNILPIVHDLLPLSVSEPEYFGELIKTEAFINYIKRLHDNGNQHNRYQIYGYSKDAGDLHKLDQLVFYVRRACQPLEAYVTPNSKHPLTFREKLHFSSDTWKVNATARIERTMTGAQGDQAKHALCNLNFSFCPNYGHSLTGISFDWNVPVLRRFIVEPIEHSQCPRQRHDAYALRDWLFHNVDVPDDIKRRLSSL